MKTYPTKYVTAARLKAREISLKNCPHAGPRANIAGMKNLYWGKDAMCIKSGQYVYKVPAWIYNSF